MRREVEGSRGGSVKREVNEGRCVRREVEFLLLNFSSHQH